MKIDKKNTDQTYFRGRRIDPIFWKVVSKTIFSFDPTFSKILDPAQIWSVTGTTAMIFIGSTFNKYAMQPMPFKQI